MTQFEEWPVIETAKIESLDELSKFEYVRGAESTFHAGVLDRDLIVPQVDAIGEPTTTKYVEFIPTESDSRGAWEQTRESPDIGAKSETHLHRLLERFATGEGPRAIYIEKSEEGGFQLTLYGDPKIDLTYRNGEPVQDDCGGRYAMPYDVPAIQDILNHAGFRFFQPRRITGANVVGRTPQATVFSLRTIIERELITKSDDFKGLLATTPSYNRRDKETLNEYMDVYVNVSPSED